MDKISVTGTGGDCTGHASIMTFVFHKVG